MAAKRRLEMARIMRSKPVSANADGPTLGRCVPMWRKNTAWKEWKVAFATEPAKLRSDPDHARPTPATSQG
jgi:hypothetical protein